MNGSEVSSENKAIEEDEYNEQRKDKKSEGEAKCVKVALCNVGMSDSYKGSENVEYAG